MTPPVDNWALGGEGIYLFVHTPGTKYESDGGGSIRYLLVTHAVKNGWRGGREIYKHTDASKRCADGGGANIYLFLAPNA